MIVLELFCGTKSIGKVFSNKGHKVFSVDINPRTDPDLCIDILDFNVSMLPVPFNKPDIIWASPPCTEYSHAKRRGIRDIEGANKIVLKTLRIIKELNPKFWFIENPQTGKLKEQPFMNNILFTDVSYCMYGYKYRKQTRIWSNTSFIGKVCDKNCGSFINGRHIESIANNRGRYTRRIVRLNEKYSIPSILVSDIVFYCETA